MTPQDKKNLLGHQAYILEGVKSLASIKSYVMKVTSPAETIEGEFIYGMVTNTVSVGGFKGLINQNVSLSDGLFEVLLIRMPKTPLEFSSIVTRALDAGGGKQAIWFINLKRTRLPFTHRSR
ncbi:MAG: hypothetical protein ACLTF6_17250 [Clostridium sp.]